MGPGFSLEEKAPIVTLATTLAATSAITPAATPATTSITKLPTEAIGKHDLSFELRSIQDLDALLDTEVLWDVRGELAQTQQREQG